MNTKQTVQRCILLLKKWKTLSFVGGNEQRCYSRYSSIFQFWPYNRFLCSQSAHGVVKNKEKVSQVYEPSVSTKRVQTNRTTFHLLLETTLLEWNVFIFWSSSSWCCRKKTALWWQRFLNSIANLQSANLIFLDQLP